MRLFRSFLIFALIPLPIGTFADDYVVKLLTTGDDGRTMIFEPGFLKVNVGDSIIFEPADPSHNAESFFSPSADSSFMTELGATVSVTMSQEGVYLYKCTPHFVLGMVGVIQVGNAVNRTEALEAWGEVKDSLVMNQGRMEEYLNKID